MPAKFLNSIWEANLVDYIHAIRSVEKSFETLLLYRSIFPFVRRAADDVMNIIFFKFIFKNVMGRDLCSSKESGFQVCSQI